MAAIAIHLAKQREQEINILNHKLLKMKNVIWKLNRCLKVLLLEVALSARWCHRMVMMRLMNKGALNGAMPFKEEIAAVCLTKLEMDMIYLSKNKTT